MPDAYLSVTFYYIMFYRKTYFPIRLSSDFIEEYSTKVLMGGVENLSCCHEYSREKTARSDSANDIHVIDSFV